jgi:hypothetical protein
MPDDFLAAGGTLSLAEWCDLTEDERAAMTAAGRRREERIIGAVFDRLAEMGVRHMMDEIEL